MTPAVFHWDASHVISRLIFPLLIGFVGAAILFWLGTWQVERLAWKQGVLAALEDKIADAPVLLPQTPDMATDQYLAVEVTGTYGEAEVHVLASTKQVGAIYRIIAPFRTTDGRVILVDRGYVLDELRDTPRAKGAATLTGNLLWPDEIDSYTPEPDLSANIWFARDVPRLAETLKTEPLLLVVRKTSQTDNGLTPLPVDTSGIPNDHFEYAVTWYGMCIVWLMMSALLVWRQIRKHEG